MPPRLSPDLHDHPVHQADPTGAPYILGRWHKDQVSAKGYSFEAKIALKTMFNAPHEGQKFIVYCRPRSGSTLLVQLLSQVPQIRCDGEVLHHSVLAPSRFLSRLASRTPDRTYGAKIVSYQLLEVQRTPDQQAFLDGLAEDGFLFVHLKRNTFDQALSLCIAQKIQKYHYKTDETGTVRSRELTVDPDLFLKQVAWNALMLDFENRQMANLPHITVDHDTELAQSELHQSCVDRVCSALNVATAPVEATLKQARKMTRVANMDALIDIAVANGFADEVDASLQVPQRPSSARISIATQLAHHRGARPAKPAPRLPVPEPLS